MIAIGLATLVVGDRSIYEHQLKDRDASPAHRFRTALPLLGSVRATDSMQPADLTIDRREPVSVARRRLSDRGMDAAPVVDEQGAYVGMVTAEALSEAELVNVGAAVDTAAPSLPEGASLEDAVESLSAGGSEQVVVLTDARRILGIITVLQVVQGYRTALQRQPSEPGRRPPRNVDDRSGRGGDLDPEGPRYRG